MLSFSSVGDSLYLLMTFCRFVVHCQRRCMQKCFLLNKVGICVCTSLLAFLSLACILPPHTHTHSETLKYTLSVSLFSVSFLPVLLTEFSIHLIPLLVLLYWGWAPLVFHVKGFLFYWTSNPLCLASHSLLLLGSMHIQEPTARTAGPASSPKFAIVGISVVTWHELQRALYIGAKSAVQRLWDWGYCCIEILFLVFSVTLFQGTSLLTLEVALSVKKFQQI